MRQIFGDILAAFWLPALAGSVMAIGTWLVWFYSGAPVSVFGGGTDAAAVMCRAGPLAPYLNLEILHYCYVHATIAITLTGGSDIMMFIRESRRNQRAEKAAEERYERERQEAEERRQQAEERRQEERQENQERYEREQERADRMINVFQTALDQSRQDQQRAEERYRQDQQRAEERYRQDLQRYEARAEADRQAFINTINQLSAAIARNGSGNGNGNGGGGHHNPQQNGA